MPSDTYEAPHAGAAPRSLGLKAGAIACSATVFVIAAVTIGTTAAAFLWGGTSLLGLGGSVVASVVGAVASLPIALWLALRTWRMETTGELAARKRSERLAGRRHGV